MAEGSPWEVGRDADFGGYELFARRLLGTDQARGRCCLPGIEGLNGLHERCADHEVLLGVELAP